MSEVCSDRLSDDLIGSRAVGGARRQVRVAARGERFRRRDQGQAAQVLAPVRMRRPPRLLRLLVQF